VKLTKKKTKNNNKLDNSKKRNKKWKVNVHGKLWNKTKEKHLKSSFDRNITGFEKKQEATLSHLIRTSVYFWIINYLEMLMLVYAYKK